MSKPRPEPTTIINLYFWEGQQGARQPEQFSCTGCKVLGNGDLVLRNARTAMTRGVVVGEYRVPVGEWWKVEIVGRQSEKKEPPKGP